MIRPRKIIKEEFPKCLLRWLTEDVFDQVIFLENVIHTVGDSVGSMSRHIWQCLWCKRILHYVVGDARWFPNKYTMTIIVATWIFKVLQTRIIDCTIVMLILTNHVVQSDAWFHDINLVISDLRTTWLFQYLKAHDLDAESVLNVFLQGFLRFCKCFFLCGNISHRLFDGLSENCIVCVYSML